MLKKVNCLNRRSESALERTLEHTVWIRNIWEDRQRIHPLETEHYPQMPPETHPHRCTHIHLNTPLNIHPFTYQSGRERKLKKEGNDVKKASEHDQGKAKVNDEEGIYSCTYRHAHMHHILHSTRTYSLLIQHNDCTPLQTVNPNTNPTCTPLTPWPKVLDTVWPYNAMATRLHTNTMQHSSRHYWQTWQLHSMNGGTIWPEGLCQLLAADRTTQVEMSFH